MGPLGTSMIGMDDFKYIVQERDFGNRDSLSGVVVVLMIEYGRNVQIIPLYQTYIPESSPCIKLLSLIHI